MTSLDMAAIHFSAWPQPTADAEPGGELALQTATLELPPLDTTPTTRIDEPSSLTLALIGMVTLAAYRGIQKRVTGQIVALSKPAKRTAPAPIKPRRRAA